MVIPDPEVGLVIHFNYLWKREAEQGREHARYARPCAVVVSRRVDASGQLVVVVAPITHAAPSTGQAAIEMPSPIKRHLSLDEDRSWIVVDEVNEFVWPGYDLEPNAKGEIGYGILPNVFFTRVRNGLLAQVRAANLSRIMRSD